MKRIWSKPQVKSLKVKSLTQMDQTPPGAKGNQSTENSNMRNTVS